MARFCAGMFGALTLKHGFKRLATLRLVVNVSTNFNPYPGNGGGEVKITRAVFAENCRVSSGMRQLFFVTLLRTRWAFRRN